MLIEIGNQRRALLRKLREALLKNDIPETVKVARELAGLPNEPEVTQ
jgi:hypothetical protein